MKPLTPSELEVLRLAAEGMLQKEIGVQRHNSRNTINTHLKRAYDKLGAVNAAHAVHIAHREGLLE